MPNPVKELGLGSSRGESLPETSDWKPQPCLRLDAAQDQHYWAVLEGSSVKILTNPPAGIDEDAQSNAGRSIRKTPNKALRAALQEALRSHRASEWNNPGAEPAIGTEAPAREAGRGDQPSIIGEATEEWSSDRLADELLRLDGENDWPCLREVIVTAEDYQFTPEQCAKLAPRLLGLAMGHRDSNDPQDEPAVFSAIRTGASMLRPNEADCLLALLAPGNSIDTSLETLKMIGRIFEAQPPGEPDQFDGLSGEVRGIANSLLNPYAIASSQTAATAQLAVYALAAMASTGTLDIVRGVQRMGVAWFTEQIAHELRELRSYWDGRTNPVAPEVLQLLEDATQVLQTT